MAEAHRKSARRVGTPVLEGIIGLGRFDRSARLTAWAICVDVERTRLIGIPGGIRTYRT
ncbi:hypothetical protein ACIRU3_27540 [Streptomyces sp. NPDC101151]|uniref:hypothetical protein n=1 Tax=Streptomyces sp. NPDC101151 TaxID=3366115 RepID=UPI003800FB72